MTHLHMKSALLFSQKNVVMQMRTILLLFAVFWGLTSSFALEKGTNKDTEEAIKHVKEHALSVSGPEGLKPLLERAAQRKLVLLGEASHGTSEYYTWRAEISKKLIEKHGFNFIIVEGDWPLAYPVNLHVKHLEENPVDSRDALAHFYRWPQWMWDNKEVLDLISWLRDHNRKLPPQERAGFYGMDIYAHDQGISDVLSFLKENDLKTAEKARKYYQCFSQHPDLQSYLQRVHRTREHCGKEMEAAYQLLINHKADYFATDSIAFIGAKQSSRMLVFAERHIRANLEQGPQAWNHRVNHFYDAAHQMLQWYGEDARGIVWAHNTHIGDARATDMHTAGMKNIGQIARQELGNEKVYAVGLGTFKGEVLAGRQWQGPMEHMTIPGAKPGSYEYLMKQAGISPLLLLFDDPFEHKPLLAPRGNRAVGVIYHPERDALQNFVQTILPERYDAFLFFENTRALTPISR